jgi:hypothetical protein
MQALQEKGLAAQAAYNPQRDWGLAQGRFGDTFTSDSFTLTTNTTAPTSTTYSANTLR